MISLQGVFEYIEELRSATSLEQVENTLASVAKLLELEFFSFALCIPTSLVSPETITLHNYSHEWNERYHTSSYLKDDPVLRYSLRNITPVVWRDLELDKSLNTPAARRVMNEAKEFGIRDGLSIPLRSPMGDTGVLSLADSGNDAETEKRIQRALPIAQTLAPYLHEAVKRVSASKVNTSQPEAENYGITRRQLECLIWAAEGKTAWEISQIVDISERTVLFHLNNAAQKLGVSSRQHAVARALMLGILSLQL